MTENGAEDHPIITREQALAAGLTRYFTGKPCKSGHVCERLVTTRTCVECKGVREIANRRKKGVRERRSMPEARVQALAAGLTRYFTGEPCKNGHVCERLTSSGMCVECNRLRSAALRANEPERVKSYERERGRHKAERREAGRRKTRGAVAEML